MPSYCKNYYVLFGSPKVRYIVFTHFVYITKLFTASLSFLQTVLAVVQHCFVAYQDVNRYDCGLSVVFDSAKPVEGHIPHTTQLFER